MKIISQALIRKHLGYVTASGLIKEGFLKMREGLLHSPSREVFRLPPSGTLMGAIPSSDGRYLCAKVAAVNYENAGRGLDSHQGAVLLFEKSSGVLKAILDATDLTAWL